MRRLTITLRLWRDKHLHFTLRRAWRVAARFA